jgi:Flp pilus assembly protein CpaB
MNLTYRARNLTLALALALGAALLVTLYVKHSHNASSAVRQVLANVFVASHDIPSGTPGTDLGGLIEAKQIPKKDVVPGAISTKGQVGALVTTQTIYAGEQVTTRRFQPQAEEGIKGEITGNQRAIQIPGDPNQLLVDTVQAGDVVDVLGNVKYKLVNFKNHPKDQQTQQADFVATRVVLRNLRVLRAPAPPAGSSHFAGQQTYSIVLALTDNQAQKLFYVIKNGDWSLQLRPAHGAADSPESAETTGSVLGDGLRRDQYLQLIFGASGPK